MEAVGGVTVIELTVARVTVSVLEVLFTPALVALMIVAPGSRPVARPLLLMLATVGWLEIHVNATLGIMLPFTSLAVATNC
jgi:hypothetical protein